MRDTHSRHKHQLQSLCMRLLTVQPYKKVFLVFSYWCTNSVIFKKFDVLSLMPTIQHWSGQELFKSCFSQSYSFSMSMQWEDRCRKQDSYMHFNYVPIQNMKVKEQWCMKEHVLLATPDRKMPNWFPDWLTPSTLSQSHIDKGQSCRVAEVREVNVVVSVVLQETNQNSSIYTFLHHKGRTRKLLLREHSTLHMASNVFYAPQTLYE